MTRLAEKQVLSAIGIQYSAFVQIDTNRLNVRSLVGLFYMLLLAVAIALLIASVERLFAACPWIGGFFSRMWHSGAPFSVSICRSVCALQCSSCWSPAPAKAARCQALLSRYSPTLQGHSPLLFGGVS